MGGDGKGAQEQGRIINKEGWGNGESYHSRIGKDGVCNIGLLWNNALNSLTDNGIQSPLSKHPNETWLQISENFSTTC